MRMKWLIAASLFFLLSSAVVNAAPIFVNAWTSDEDLIYGPNDNIININMSWDNKDYNVTADFSVVDTSLPATEDAVDNDDGTYSVSHTIVTPGADNPTANIGFTAVNSTDLSTTVVNAYNVTLDSTSPTITAESKSPPVSFENQSIILNATITDANGLKGVVISINHSGVFQNYSVIGNDSLFSFTLGGANISSGEAIAWKYYARDRANNVAEGTLQVSPTVNSTGITLVPLAPDGSNGWYVTEPSVVLTPDSGRTAYYRFNGGPLLTYTGPFNVSGVPGGIRVLTYLSNDTVFNIPEPERTQTIKVDITNPKAYNFFPVNGSVTFNTTTKISASLTETYGSNSGINVSLLILKVNGAAVTPTNVTQSSVVYYPPALPEGENQVRIENLVDLAGNLEPYINWSFTIDNTNVSAILFSPLNKTYNTTNVPVIIQVNQPVKAEYSDNGNSFSTISSSTSLLNTTRSFSEGDHYVVFRLTSLSNGASNALEANFSVDNKAPSISAVLPAGGSHVRGLVNFSIKYTEKFLSNITLHTKKTTDAEFVALQLTGCQSGSVKECRATVDLSSYNGPLLFFFNVTDQVFTTLTGIANVVVDNVIPTLMVASPTGTTFGSRKVLFDIASSEFARVDYSDNRRSFRRLCNNCTAISKNVTLQEGWHNVTFRATDFALNEKNETVNLLVDSIAPRIRGISPKGSEVIDGPVNFSIKYAEANLNSLTLLTKKEGDAGFTPNALTCTSGSNEICSTTTDFSPFNGMVTYYFSVADDVRVTNSTPLNFTIDTINPAITLLYPVDSSVSNKPAINLTVSVNENVKFIKRSINGASNGTMCASCNGSIQNLNLANGNYSIRVSVQDLAGNNANKSVFFSISS